MKSSGIRFFFNDSGACDAPLQGEILWHPLFPAAYVARVGKLPLAEVSAFQQQLPGWCNQGRALDCHDLYYLADCLREALANQPNALEGLRLNRALDWVRQSLTANLSD